jgi:hypothetical protein
MPPQDSIAKRLLLAVVLLSASACEPEVRPDKLPDTVFDCRLMLIGKTSETCLEDVVGPGLVTVSIRPEPEKASWELGIRGLVALSEACAFEGSFDQTRLASLQGRGAVSLTCRVGDSVSRPYLQIRFEQREEMPNTAIQVAVTFEREAP